MTVYRMHLRCLVSIGIVSGLPKACFAFMARPALPIPQTHHRQQSSARSDDNTSTVYYTAPALPTLDGKGQAPPLSVVCTSRTEEIEKWLQDHVVGVSQTKKSRILGFDIETTARAPWFPERKGLKAGPACLQLSTLDSCLIVHLAHCCKDDDSANVVPRLLLHVLNDRQIIKAGVGIDDDALELYRWSNKNDNNHNGCGWQVTSRLDLCAVAGGTSYQRMGLRQVTSTVVNVDLPKSKKLTMSNWNQTPLSSAQVAYAARDAWAAAAVVDVLQQRRNDVFGVDALLNSVLREEGNLAEMDQRARARRKVKMEFKAIEEEEKELYLQGVKMLPEKRKDTKRRKDQLLARMSELRPDPPPVFDLTDLGLPF